MLLVLLLMLRVWMWMLQLRLLRWWRLWLLLMLRWLLLLLLLLLHHQQMIIGDCDNVRRSHGSGRGRGDQSDSIVCVVLMGSLVLLQIFLAQKSSAADVTHEVLADGFVD